MAASLRQVYLYLCLCHLLMVAAFAARLPPPGTSLDAACYKTVTSAPKDCAGEFIQAVFTGKKEYITEACCVILACVREWSCADTLGRFCLPPEANACSPSSAPLSSPSAAYVSTSMTYY